MATTTGGRSQRAPEATLPVWARIAACVGVSIVAGAAVLAAISAAIASTEPNLAFALDGSNSRAGGLLTERTLGDAANSNNRSAAGLLAKRVLSRDPANVPAIVSMALSREVHRPGSGKSLMDLAQRLSRRDLRTQIWFIEDAVGRGQIDQALDHYDLALRTASAAPGLLFPTLNRALDDAAIRRALIGRLQKVPPWGDAFLIQAGSTAPDVTATLALFSSLARENVPLPALGWTAVVNRAALAGNAEGAMTLYRLLHPGTNRLVRDPRFEAQHSSTSVFDWNVFGEGSVTADVGRGLSFESPPGAAGLAARQMLMLRPGRYSFSSAVAPGAVNSKLAAWTMNCVDTGQTIANLPLDLTSSVQTFTVPSSCSIQWLSLEIRMNDAAEGVSGVVERVTVMRH